MALTVQIGVLLALATALASVAGFLLKARGAVESPEIEWRRPISTSLALFRSRTYTIGMVVAMASWGLHVAALSLAPISLVQSVIAGGLVSLTVMAHALFDHHVTRREWVGVALTAAGLAFLAATMSGAGKEAYSDYEPGVLALYAGFLTAAGLVAAVAGWYGLRGGAVAVGAGAGLLWGASDVSIKALSGSLGDDGIAVLVHPLAAVILLLSLTGLVVSTRSLQTGRAVPVIAATSAAANITTIAAGLVVFAEPLPEDTLGVVMRLSAFALVVVAASLTPPPGAATEPRAAVA